MRRTILGVLLLLGGCDPRATSQFPPSSGRDPQPASAKWRVDPDPNTPVLWRAARTFGDSPAPTPSGPDPNSPPSSNSDPSNDSEGTTTPSDPAPATPDPVNPPPQTGCQPIGYEEDSRLEWTLEYLSNPDAVSDVWASGPDDAYAITTSGRVFHSKGDGNWELVYEEPGALFHSIWGSSADDVYVVGSWTREAYHSMAPLLHSSDRGATWQQQWTGYEALTQVTGVSAAEVYAVANGPLTRTTNGGEEWIKIEQNLDSYNFVPSDIAVVRTSAGDATRIIFVGSGAKTSPGQAWNVGGLRRSVDGGATWVESTFDAASFASVWAFDAEHLIAVGVDRISIDRPGKIATSSDFGDHWTVRCTDGIHATLTDVWAADSMDVYAVGGLALHSIDGGISWKRISFPTNSPNGYVLPYSVWGTSREDVYFGGLNGIVLHGRPRATQ